MHVKINSPLWDFKKGKFSDTVGEEKYVDDSHYHILKTVLAERQKHQWDNWFIYCGDEGDGKSTLAKQDCALMAQLTGGRFDVTRISWEPKVFAKHIDDSKPGDSILYDETITGFNSKRTMSEINNILFSKAVMCRKKMLFVGLCIPSLFSLQKEIAVRRSFGMCKVYADKVKRGFYNYYNRTQKRILYIKGKKYEDMNAYKGSKPLRFLLWSTVDEDKYEFEKDEAQKRIGETPDKFNKYLHQRNIAWLYLDKMKAVKTEIAKFYGKYGHQLTGEAITKALKPYKDIEMRQNRLIPEI